MKSRSCRIRTFFQKSFVGFLLGDIRYAVDVLDVLQVIHPLPLTALPHMPPCIIGISEYREFIVPIVDLRTYFKLPTENSRKTKWLLLCVDDAVMGIVVDAVTGVFGSEQEKIRPLPDLGLRDDHQVLEGMISHDGQMSFLLGSRLLYEIAKPAVGMNSPPFSLDSLEPR